MKKAILLSTLISLFTILSCSRGDSSINNTSDETSASMAASASTVTTSSDIIQTDVLQVIYSTFYKGSSLIGKGNSDKDFLGCLNGATVTKTTVNGVTTITVDYGTGITDNHGRTRAGQITIVTSGNASTKDLSTKVTFNNFSIDGNVITGSYAFTIVLDANGSPVITRTEDINITKADGSGTVTRKGTFIRTMTAGYNTPKDVSDDVWIEIGNATMTDANGTYSVTITKPIVFTVSCGYRVSGIIEFNKSGSIYTLDYGDGTCDNTATLTKPDGTVTTVNIKMPKRKR